MIDKLTLQEIAMVLESLKYTKLRFEEYDKYPSYEYKLQRIKEMIDLINKIENLK
jgi:hypothetical protein